MKKLTTISLLCVGFFISSGTVFADSNFQGCDQTNITGVFAPGAICPTGLDISRTLSGIQFIPHSISGSPTVVYFSFYKANFGTYVGSIAATTTDWTLDQPTFIDTSSLGLTYSAGDKPDWQICATPNVTCNGQSVTAKGDMTGSYTIWYWDANTPYGSHTTPISYDAPTLFATTTSPATVQFTYLVANTQWSPNPASTNQNPNLSGYELTFRNSKTLASKNVFGSLPDTSPGIHHVSTSVSLDQSGTYYSTIILNNWISGQATSDYRQVYSSNVSAVDYFGINFNDAIQTVTVGTTTCTSAASSSQCALFSGTADLGTCASYLFVPGACAFEDYSAIPQALSNSFPFAYVASIGAAWSNLQASTTANSPTLAFNLRDLGIGSTTALGNLQPNITVFSASTTKQYFSNGTFDALKGMAAIAIILETIYFIWRKTHGVITV